MEAVKTERLEIRATEAFVKKLDNWRRQQPHMPSRSQALREIAEQMFTKKKP